MKGGEEREFELVYREYAPQVYRCLRRMGCPAQDAEDVTQDTFVKALLSIDGYRGECKLSVWLCQIAKNTWLTDRKKRGRETGEADVDIVVSQPHDVEWADLIDCLEEPYRSVFWKRAVGGWSFSQLARRYGKSESWARVTYHRARMKLRLLMEEGGV